MFLPEFLALSGLLLIFFFLILAVIVIMLIHHYLQSKKHPQTAQELLSRHPYHQHLPPSNPDSDIEKLETYYLQNLHKSFDYFSSRLEESTNKAEGEFTSYLEDLRTRSEQTSSLLDQSKQERLDKLFLKMEENITQLINSTMYKHLANIENELDSSRRMVESYAQKQLHVIDQNIIDILERTLSIVLVKKLSLREQLDLVYEALEKAKAEKYLAGLSGTEAGSETKAKEQNSQPSVTNSPTNPKG